MKYLVYLQPQGTINSAIVKYRKPIGAYIDRIPDNGPHCTIMTLRTKPENEQRIVTDLEKIAVNLFSVEFDDLDIFDKNSLVFKLKKTPRLMGFHQKTIDALKRYIDWSETPVLPEEYLADSEREKVYKTYGYPHYAQFYNPHVTIAKLKQKSIDLKNFDKDAFNKHSWIVTSFYLSKKENGIWKEVKEFSF